MKTNKTVEVTYEFFNDLVAVAHNAGLEVDIFEGSLLDNLVISGAEILKIRGIKRAKHIIIEERAKNEWSSGLYLWTTASEAKADKAREMFSN